jgi:hypothetical protein
MKQQQPPYIQLFAISGKQDKAFENMNCHDDMKVPEVKNAYVVLWG